jgi:hypothetical protein
MMMLVTMYDGSTEVLDGWQAGRVRRVHVLVLELQGMLLLLLMVVLVSSISHSPVCC